MKRIITLVVVLLVACGSLLARRVPAEKALGYARNWWLQKDGPRSAVLEPVATEFQNIYLFVDTAGRGFVMLAADDRSLPVLGYSLSNGFVADSTMPAAVHDWVQDYDDQIQFLIDNNIEKTAEINEQWKDLNNEWSQLPATWGSEGPLVSTRWSQAHPFNKQCPSGSSTGCVATAMAQIMKKWNHPATGNGQHSYYSSSVSSTLTANFGTTTYQWISMPDIADGTWNNTQEDAVATLMYHIGVAVEMNYGYQSSAQTVATTYEEPAAVNAYRKYFKYKWTARSVCMDDYTRAAWKQLLKNEIDNGRPMQYGGHGGGGGHSFVCDGYNQNEMFHFNWGWGGTDDGYYAVGALNVGYEDGYYNHQYNYSNYAIIGIEPDNNTGGSSNVTVNVNDASLGSVTGGGTYQPSQLVELTPHANSGCKFVGWSNGSRDVPLKFVPNGENVTLTANFDRLSGDTMFYCNSACIKIYGNQQSQQYWGIKIPAANLTSGSYLTDVMIYVPMNGTYDIYLNLGSFDVNTVDATLKSTSPYQWVNIPINPNLSIDGTQDLYIAIKSYYASSSMPAANADASSINASGSWGHQTNVANADVAWMIKAIIATEHKIAINKDAVQLTATSRNVDLTSKKIARSNRGAPVSYQFVSSTPDNIVTMYKYYGSDCLDAKGAGIVTIKATATDPTLGPAVTEFDLKIDRGTLYFKSWANDWFSVDSWGPHYDAIPDSINYDVEINGECIINNNAQCHDLSIGEMYYMSLTVGSNGVLEMSGKLNNTDSDKLIIHSDITGSGTVIFGSGTPKATVETYLKGTIGTDGKDPQWQLRGSVVGEDFALENSENEWNNIHVYEWDEKLNANTSSGCWKNLMVGSAIKLAPWKGYGFANYSTSPVTVKYTGTLINKDHSWTLSKTGSGNANVGNNMLTNSFSAPVDIRSIDFGGARKSVIFYNTGSLLEWMQFNGDTANWTQIAPGQMLVCPAYTAAASGMPTTIPSGQSFYVVANNNGDAVDIAYSNVVNSASGLMYAPAEEEQFNVLGVRITGENGGDRAVLIECVNCSDDYDDGYDGMKYFGNAALPQLYVVNDFGNTSINAAESIVGKRLGVHTSDKGKCLTMTFETEKLNGYSQLKLKDLKTGKYADILSGREYQFTTTGDDDARFEVVGFAEDDDNEQMDELTVVGNTLYVGKYAGRVSMYDMSGRLVWYADVQPDEWLELPELMHGVYAIKTDCSTTKITK